MNHVRLGASHRGHAVYSCCNSFFFSIACYYILGGGSVAGTSCQKDRFLFPIIHSQLSFTHPLFIVSFSSELKLLNCGSWSFPALPLGHDTTQLQLDLRLWCGAVGAGRGNGTDDTLIRGKEKERKTNSP